MVILCPFVLLPTLSFSLNSSSSSIVFTHWHIFKYQSYLQSAFIFLFWDNPNSFISLSCYKLHFLPIILREQDWAQFIKQNLKCVSYMQAQHPLLNWDTFSLLCFPHLENQLLCQQTAIRLLCQNHLNLHSIFTPTRQSCYLFFPSENSFWNDT